MLGKPQQRWCMALLAMFGLGGLHTIEAQVVAELPPIGRVMRHIRSISPRTGPVGTEVQVWTDGLPASTRFHVAMGEMHGGGYEVSQPARTNARGELAATLEVPEWGHWDHFELVMILDEEFLPIASSDPFHVANDEGLVQRDGVVEIAWPGCAALKSWNGVTYALVGEEAFTMMAAAGRALIVEGRIVDGGGCTLQDAIEVVRMRLPPAGS